MGIVKWFRQLFLNNDFSSPSVFAKTAPLKIGYMETQLSDYVVVDIETTGLSPTKDHIVQIALAKYINHSETSTFESLIKPPCHIPERVSKIHGINDEMVLYAPDIQSLRQRIESFIGTSIVAGYNLNFDLSFLRSAFGPEFDDSLQIFDVLPATRMLIPGLPSYKLADVAHSIGFIGKSHNALSDCRATAMVIAFLSQPIEGCTTQFKIENGKRVEI